MNEISIQLIKIAKKINELEKGQSDLTNLKNCIKVGLEQAEKFDKIANRCVELVNIFNKKAKRWQELSNEYDEKDKVQECKNNVEVCKDKVKEYTDKVKEYKEKAYHELNILYYNLSGDYYETIKAYGDYINENKLFYVNSLHLKSDDGKEIGTIFPPSEPYNFFGWVEYAKSIYRDYGFNKIKELFDYLLKCLDPNKLKSQIRKNKRDYILNLIENIDKGQSIEALNLSDEAQKRICCLYTNTLPNNIKEYLSLNKEDPKNKKQYKICPYCYHVTPIDKDADCLWCFHDDFKKPEFTFDNLNDVKKYINTPNAEKIMGFAVQDIIQKIIQRVTKTTPVQNCKNGIEKVFGFKLQKNKK